MATDATEPLPMPTLNEPRPQYRTWFAHLTIATVVCFMLGMTLRIHTHLEANDISRWCTVWSLLERGTYIIDECPWQNRTQDKVYKVSPFAEPGDTTRHFYSSKPPLLPTMIAGILYPVRKVVKVPLDKHIDQVRVERTYMKEDPDIVGKYEMVTETPPPVKWNAFVFYLKPMVVLLNILPFWLMLVLYVRLLDRYARNDWAWLFGLVAAAFGTPLTIFLCTLNNHTVAAISAFYASYALLRIWEKSAEDPNSRLGKYYVAAGFFGAFCACNELPAAAFGVLLFLLLSIKDFKRTLVYFVPAAIPPCLAFLITQYLATGSLKPFYAEFGTASYTGYEWSYWNTPLEFDWFDKHPEPRWVYLTHLLVGHHGVFSLTPIFLFSLASMLSALVGKKGPLKNLAALTLTLTVILVGFYTYKTNNYGGSTQGPRWLFWIYPLWLMLLPPALSKGETSKVIRWLSLIALAFSIFTVGYASRSPWSNPWILDFLEHLNLYTLTR